MSDRTAKVLGWLAVGFSAAAVTFTFLAIWGWHTNRCVPSMIVCAILGVGFGAAAADPGVEERDETAAS